MHYKDSEFIDVTLKGDHPWVMLSPYYPHGGIPIPYFPSDFVSVTVEGIYEGLKIFEFYNIDISKFQEKNFAKIKRPVKNMGQPIAIKKGIHGHDSFDLITARKEIYIKSYEWVLNNKVHDLIILLKNKSEKNDIVLLDNETNDNIENTSRPLSHAALVKNYITCKFP